MSIEEDYVSQVMKVGHDAMSIPGLPYMAHQMIRDGMLSRLGYVETYDKWERFFKKACDSVLRWHPNTFKDRYIEYLQEVAADDQVGK